MSAHGGVFQHSTADWKVCKHGGARTAGAVNRRCHALEKHVCVLFFGSQRFSSTYRTGPCVTGRPDTILLVSRNLSYILGASKTKLIQKTSRPPPASRSSLGFTRPKSSNKTHTEKQDHRPHLVLGRDLIVCRRWPWQVKMCTARFDPEVASRAPWGCQEKITGPFP